MTSLLQCTANFFFKSLDQMSENPPKKELNISRWGSESFILIVFLKKDL